MSWHYMTWETQTYENNLRKNKKRCSPYKTNFFKGKTKIIRQGKQCDIGCVDKVVITYFNSDEVQKSLAEYSNFHIGLILIGIVNLIGGTVDIYF